MNAVSVTWNYEVAVTGIQHRYPADNLRPTSSLLLSTPEHLIKTYRLSYFCCIKMAILETTERLCVWFYVFQTEITFRYLSVAWQYFVIIIFYLYYNFP